MRVKGILIHSRDQVITIVSKAVVNDVAVYECDGKILEAIVKEEIPQYHKMACRNIGKGEKVYKYGEVVGEALSDIMAGCWVHVHNLKSSCMVSEG